MDRRPSADEGAAIVAAVERFRVETAAKEGTVEGAVGAWQRAALQEGIGAKGAVQKHLEGGLEWLS